MVLSAQDFIRSLRAPADPPQPGGPAKIQIARAVWDDHALYVPSKGEAIVEWLLARLLKDKDNEASTSPVIDERYWALLRDVLVDPDTLKLRPVKAWLVPILQRTPLAPVVIAALASWAKHASTNIHASAECLSALWPLAAAKLSAETLLDCFAAVIQLSIGYSKIQRSLGSDAHARINTLCQQLLGSYRYALANASNKKKLFSVFIQQHLQSWILSVVIKDGYSALAPEDVYEAGVETIFNVDILRQIQDRDDTVLSDPLSKAVDSDPTPLCQILPRLLGAYIQVVRKHRAALFGQSSHQATGSSADQARIASLRFIATCDSISRKTPDINVRWQTRVQLLQIMDAEGLYGATNNPVMDVLQQSKEDAIYLLAEAIREGHHEQVEYAFGVLAAIAHIDYDLVSHSVPRVLPLFLACQSSNTSASAFLRHLLEYHSKTRTIDSLVESVLTACSLQTVNGITVPPLSAHKSPIFQYEFSDNLAKSIASFLTPGQVIGSVDCVLQHLRAHLDLLQSTAASAEDPSKKPHKKRRKVNSSSTPEPSDASRQTAVAFSLVSRIASVVVSSLPNRYLLDHVQTHITESFQDFYDVTRSALKDMLKRIKRTDQTTQHLQWVAALVVRLRYTIRTSTVIHISTKGDEKISAKLLSAINYADSPRFRVEILRTLLSDVDLTHCEPLPVFDATLNLLESKQPGGSCYWNGSVDDIQDSAQSAIAVCHLTFNRWLPLLDAAATSEQLARLASFLTSPHLSTQPAIPCPPNHVTLHDILRRSLHNADIWELERFRDALLERINAVTVPLDAIDVKADLTTPSRQSTPAEYLASVAATYRLLLCIPTEYLTRNIRNDLMRRALTVDVVCVRSSFPSLAYAPLFFREFLKRLFQFMGGVEHGMIGPYLAFLLQQAPSTPSGILVATTSELVRMHMTTCVKSSIKGDYAVLNDVVHHITTFVANKVSVEEREQHQVTWLGVMHLVDAVVAEVKIADLSSAVLEPLKALHQQLSSTLLPLITALCSQEIHDTDVSSLALLLNLWHRCLVLRRWLSPEDQLPSFGKAIVARLIKSMPTLPSASYSIYVASASIVQEECRSQLSDQDEGLDVVLASHLAFYQASASPGKVELDELLAKFLKGTSTTSFSYLLDLVSEGLSAPGLDLSNVAVLVHAYTLLLQNAPEGSSKIIQSSWNRCLQLFASKRELLESTSTRLAVLHSISRQFNDRPALVRQVDLSSLWSILGSSLDGSQNHEPATDKATFHEIISTVNALIRLRRDLVTSTLPHLAFILRRLLMSLRHLRPQLGAKQGKMVTDTLPMWLNPSQPFTSEESKALARLLTTMITKTVVRGQQSSTDAGKAENLARPFSKHAAYVLQAYVEALNDPLCVVPADTRRELEPGLFALCEMIGEYSRDALMVASLDAGGKTVLKSIWREYEKQKYVGKG